MDVQDAAAHLEPSPETSAVHNFTKHVHSLNHTRFNIISQKKIHRTELHSSRLEADMSLLATPHWCQYLQQRPYLNQCLYILEKHLL